MASSLADLFVRLTADTKEFKQPLADAGKQLEEFSKSTISIGQSLALALPFAAIGLGAIHEAEKFEEAGFAMRKATGLTGEALHGLEGSFKTLYATTAAPAEALTAALSTLSVRTGLTGKALEDLTKTNLQFAKVTGTDVKTAVEETQKVFHAWGISTTEQAEKLNFLRNVTLVSGGTVSALVSTLETAGPVLRSIGFTFEESAQLAGNFTREGLNADSMVKFLSKGMATFAKEGITDAKAQLTALIERLKGATQGSAIMQQAVHDLGARGFAVALDAINKGTFDLDAFGKKVAAQTDSISKAATETKSWHSTLTLFTHQLELALDQLGAPLLSALSEALKAIKPMISGLGEMAQGFGSLPKGVQLTVEALVGVVAIAPLAIKAFASISTMLTATLIPALANPYVLAILGLAAVVGAGVGMAQSIGKTNAALDEAYAKLNKTGEATQKRTAEEGKATLAGERFHVTIAKTIPTLQLGETELKKMAEAAKKLADALDKAYSAAGLTSPGSIKAAIEDFRLLSLEFKQGEITAGQYATAWGNLGKAMTKVKPEPLAAAALLHDAFAGIDKDILDFSQIQRTVGIALRTFGTDFLLLAQDTAEAAKGIELFTPRLIDVQQSLSKFQLGAAFERQGIKSSAALRTLAENAEADYRTISESAQATTVDIQRAWVAMTTAQIEAGYTFTREQLNNYERIKASVGSATKTIDTAWKALGHEVTTIMNDLGRGIAQAIIQFKSMGDVFKKVAQDIAEAILRIIIQSGIHKLIDSLSQLSGILGKIGVALGGSGGQAGGGVLGTTVGASGGAAATIGGGAASAGGSVAASVGSAAASSLAGWINVGVSALSGIVQGIQGARLNNLMAEVEESTRYAKGYLLNLNTIQLTYLPELKHLTDIWGAINQVRDKIGPAVNVTVNVSGSGNPDATADAIVRKLKALSPVFAGI